MIIQHYLPYSGLFKREKIFIIQFVTNFPVKNFYLEPHKGEVQAMREIFPHER